MNMGTIVKLESTPDNHPDAHALLASVEAKAGRDNALAFALDMLDAGSAYVIARYGTASLLDALMSSVAIDDALTREMTRGNRRKRK
jgi:hypothetical protein